MSKQVTIHSDNRSNGDSSSFTIDVKPELHGCYKVGGIIFQNQIYNIGPNTDKLVFDEAGTTRLATIVHGFYTNSTISSAVKTALDNASATSVATVSRSNITDELTIATTESCYYYSSADDKRTTAAPYLGINSTSNASTSYVTDGCLSLSYPSEVFIRIQEAVNDIAIGDNRYCCRVPIGGYGSVMLLDESNNREYIRFDNKVSQLNISLYDHKGKPIDNNGAPWSITMRKE